MSILIKYLNDSPSAAKSCEIYPFKSLGDTFLDLTIVPISIDLDIPKIYSSRSVGIS